MYLGVSDPQFAHEAEMIKVKKKAISAKDALWRDECAMRAMQGLLAHEGFSGQPSMYARGTVEAELATLSFKIANAMLKTRSKQ